MTLAEWATYLLLSITAMLKVETLPPQDASADWTITNPWHRGSYGLHMSSESTTIPSRCQAQPLAYVQFPVVIHGAHELFLDGKRIEVFGDPSFQRVRSFYGTLVVSCQSLVQGKTLRWQLSSYSQYFARFTKWPEITLSAPRINFFQETLNAVTSGGLIMLALISLFVFWGRVSHLLTLSLVGAGLAFAGYFIATTAYLFNLPWTMLTLHKIADISLWTGTLLLFNAFRVSGLFGRRLYLFYCLPVALAVTVIALGQTGDTIQLGTTIPFALFFGVMGKAMINLLKRSLKIGFHRTSILQILSLSSFIFISCNDILVVLGLLQGPVLLSIGVLGGVTFLALDVHERIVEAYRERDYLRHNLEHEVTLKTAELTAKTKELEEALAHLKHAQADLVQSSKMASLGMVAAGIAHEINNSLNYVHGALSPLKRILGKNPGIQGEAQALKLLSVMQDGLKLTFDIMNSLRTYSGLNHAAMKEHKVIDLVRSTLTILNNRIQPGVRIEVDIADDLEMTVNAAAMNQALMNLLCNALDAIGDQGSIQIQAKQTAQHLQISVIDDGPGVPESIRDRVFDPFFTTKDVGKGTGLGLHISRNEISKHGGKLWLDTASHRGSTFTISLPRGVPPCSP